MKALAFTPAALMRLSQYSIAEEWFLEFGLPTETGILKRVLVNDVLYIIDKNTSDDTTPLVVLNLEGDHSVFVLNRNDNVPSLDRLITVAQANYSASVKIPTTWRPYNKQNLLSLYAAPRSKGTGARLHIDRRPDGNNDLYVFAYTEETIEFESVPKNMNSYKLAKKHFADAILTPEPAEKDQSSRAGIILSGRLPQGMVQGASLDEWYNSKLTNAQRNFVDKPYDGPVRLRGAAGTGKTLSLVIKFLRDGLNFEIEKRDCRIGFLTHSLASVDLITAVSANLDGAELAFGQGKHCRLEIRTIYDIAHEHLHFALNDLEPLSLDGREGRKMQFELIKSVVKSMYTSPVLIAQFKEISGSLFKKWELVNSNKGDLLITDIMNEFANVLDAEGIRSHEQKGESYAKDGDTRPRWLMSLPLELDRRWILEIHRRYRIQLAEMKTISVDQMVGDFNSFLDSSRWDYVRSRLGYDALFVDELHLFNATERELLHKLIKRNTDDEGKPTRPPIFMAYDLKQASRDSFTSYFSPKNTLFGASTGLQNSELVKLDHVFRYTPEIAEFLTDLDASFPAIDVPGEWDAYSGKAVLASGKAPEHWTYPDELALFRNVFDLAHKAARTNTGGGRRVAVLCASEEMFDRYIDAAKGQYEGKIFPIENREPSSELRHAGKRFIFSMPEYVAGLQFETVFLIHVDAVEAPQDAGLGVRRRFISNVYLGSSRAEMSLRICTCRTRGGMSDILNMAVARGSLIES